MPPRKRLAPLDERQRYTVAEAIEYLRSSRFTIYAAIKTGQIATIKQGARRYVPGTEIARLSRAPAQPPQPSAA